MKIVSIQQQIDYLELYTSKVVANQKSLHRNEKQKAFLTLCNLYSDIALDIYVEYKNYDNELYHRMETIRNHFIEILR